MSAHTPGTWAYRGEDKTVVRVSPSGSMLDTLHIARVCNQEENTEANARLIAAAPDLLEALSQIVDALPTRRDWLDPVLEKIARAAIAKAKGEAK